MDGMVPSYWGHLTLEEDMHAVIEHIQTPIQPHVRNQDGPILIVGGTGKTGRRVAEQLEARGLPVRIGSRSAAIPFDWEDQSTWALAPRGTFVYHFMPSIPFGCLALAWALIGAWRRGGLWRAAAILYVLAVVATFAFAYPV